MITWFNTFYVQELHVTSCFWWLIKSQPVFSEKVLWYKHKLLGNIFKYTFLLVSLLLIVFSVTNLMNDEQIQHCCYTLLCFLFWQGSFFIQTCFNVFIITAQRAFTFYLSFILKDDATQSDDVSWRARAFSMMRICLSKKIFHSPNVFVFCN